MASRTGGIVAGGMAILFLGVFAGCQQITQMTGLGTLVPQKRITLFNGEDLTGWQTYLPDEADVAAESVWQVRDGVICCAGKPNGYIRTQNAFADYHLHLEWRWADEPTNSGVLLNAAGKDQIWPRCIEAQLKAQNAGDLVLIGHTGITVMEQRYQDPEKQFVIIGKRRAASEQPPGLWNAYDIYCQPDKITLFVNGIMQNQGFDPTVTAGRICLQSEGSPIEFRNIYVEPVGISWP
ncbi:MAG: DUF1080 domain-containing protein [Sedimentisphaerales bacterium]|nr:DUF1080 domain-containing protein [Sedimentisphaerales bacterium]